VKSLFGERLMTPDELRAFSEFHLSYEIDMCFGTAELLRPFAAPKHVLYNALVESYALHLRNLIEFLYDAPTRPDDVNAVHYVRADVEWRDVSGTTPSLLEDAKQRAHKQIAHITEKRFADRAPEKEWRFVVELGSLLAGLRLFLQYADPERLHPKVSAAVNGLATFVDKWQRATGEQKR